MRQPPTTVGFFERHRLGRGHGCSAQRNGVEPEWYPV